MISIISFTSSGYEIGEIISSKFENSKHYYNKNLSAKISDLMEEIYKESQSIIFISATGIAVRMISPYIKNKKVDPAVLVIDDKGQFIIPILSGHVGGANELAQSLAGYLPNSTAVITTASDSRGFTSPDLFAKVNGFSFYREEKLTEITAAMVEGEEVYLYNETETLWDYPRFKEISSFENLKSTDKLIVISSKKISGDFDFIQMLPKNLHLGIGCRRGVSFEVMEEFVEKVFRENQLLIEGIKSISSIDIKADEDGILSLAKRYGADTIFYNKDELAKVEDMFPSSDFVKKTVGAGSVAEGSSYLTSGNIIISKQIGPSMTLAVGRK